MLFIIIILNKNMIISDHSIVFHYTHKRAHVLNIIVT